MERLFKAIPTVLNSVGSHTATDEALVLAAWRECAGELLSQRTAAMEFFEDRLVVAAGDDTWRRHLEELAPQLVYKLNGRLGDGTVRYIEFVVDAGAIGRKTADAGEQQDATRAVLDDSLAAAAEAIADPALREQFIDAAAVYLARQKQL